MLTVDQLYLQARLFRAINCALRNRLNITKNNKYDTAEDILVEYMFLKDQEEGIWFHYETELVVFIDINDKHIPCFKNLWSINPKLAQRVISTDKRNG